MREVKVNQLIPGVLWLVTMVWLMQVSRSDFAILWFSYTIAFVAYVFLVIHKKPVNIKLGLFLAIIVRLVSFLFDPLLSDDYYRFIWDGMLIHSGVHPMAYTPSYLMSHPEVLAIDTDLFHLLNSKDYYSVYPPIAQWVFGLAYWIGGIDLHTNIFCYKVVLLAADVSIVYLLSKLLQKRNLPINRVLIFALNPLIVLEFMGNLHMDGLMIAGLLGAIYFIETKKPVKGVAAMIFSILSKMLTLLLLPFLIKKHYWQKIFPFSIITVGISALVFWISFGANMGWITSIGLWFQTFEFNASLFYLVRYAGFLLKGYDMIGVLGPAFAFVFLIGLFAIWLKYISDISLDSTHAMLFALTLFFLCSTTVHPWYIGTLLVLGVLSLHNYPVVWTYLIFLSYSHYEAGGFMENYWLIALEYTLLLVFIAYEWKSKRIRPDSEKGYKKTLA